MSKLSILGVILIFICISSVLGHGDEERPTKKVKTTLADRTAELKNFHINYITRDDNQDKIGFEIKNSQISQLFANDYCKWKIQFFNVSNYWKFVCQNGKELDDAQGLVMAAFFGEKSEIGDVKVTNKILQEFTLKKPENKHYNFEHSKLKNGCYKVDIYPFQVEFHALELRFCVENDKEAVVDKYRYILEDKQLGKKIFE